MKIESLWLKLSLVLFSVPVFALCWFVVIPLSREIVEYVVILAPFRWGIVGVLYAAALAFLDALVQAFRLLRLIDQQIAFSVASHQRIRHIRRDALAIAGCFSLLLPVVYFVADLDDAPGLIVVGLSFVFLALVVAAFARILEKLLDQAISLKADVDLTV